jgi:hypothetical protein
MATITYLDFDLLIEGSEPGYRARVLNSPAGQANAEFTLPFSELELENFLLRVGRTRRGVRRLESPEMEAARAFGGRLFRAVFGGEVRSCLRSSLNEARQQGAGLRIRLRLADVPELVDLPWEYLYDSALDRFLVLSVDTPLVRYLDLPERIQPLALEPPLRVMAMISCPSDYPALDADQEWAKLKEALSDLEQRGLVTVERLEEATLAALQRWLRRGEYHIFHFVGHGGFDEQARDGVLILEDEQGRGRPVSGRYLGTLLHDEHTLRLAVLNACEGARSSRSDPFAGTAQSLVRQGTPAVIAMQFEITDEAAIALAHEFYAALADGYPVDGALAEARKAIFGQENDVEWGTPVLYMRSPDGHIFDVEWVSEEARKSAQVAALYREAQVAMAGEDWATAIEKLQAVLALDPAHAEAVAGLSHAQRQQERATQEQADWARQQLRRPPSSGAPTWDVQAIGEGILIAPPVERKRPRRWVWVLELILIALVTVLPCVLYVLYVNPGLKLPKPTPAPGMAEVVLTFGGEGIAPGLFNGASNLAVDSAGNIYVADKSGRLQVFDADGNFRSLWALDDSQASVTGLSVGRAGTVYVVWGGDIHRYDSASASGEYLGQVEKPSHASFGDAATTADGKLVALAFPPHGLVRFDAEGDAVQTISIDTIKRATNFSRIAVDGLGNMYVLGRSGDTLGNSNDVVFRFAADGEYLSQFGSSGDERGQFHAGTTNAIAVDGQGRIYVSDFDGIKIFDPSGRYLGLIDVEETWPFRDLAFSDQNELVALSNSEQVFKFVVHEP